MFPSEINCPCDNHLIFSSSRLLWLLPELILSVDDLLSALGIQVQTRILIALLHRQTQFAIISDLCKLHVDFIVDVVARIGCLFKSSSLPNLAHMDQSLLFVPRLNIFDQNKEAKVLHFHNLALVDITKFERNLTLLLSLRGSGSRRLSVTTLFSIS